MDVIERVKQAENLPSLPTIAIEVLRLTRSDDVSMEQLASVIQNDPALSGRILKVVNSSMFGMAREVGTIKQAMVIMGLRAVKVMALSFSVVDALRGTSDETFDMQGYWRRSLTAAVAARLLGKALHPKIAEEAFVAGLLSDIGMCAAARCISDEYLPTLAEWRLGSDPLCSVELERIGVTHATLGRELLKTWNLPDTLTAAVGAHHGEGFDELPADTKNLASIVYSASTIAELFSGDISACELDQVKSEIAQLTGANAAQLEELFASLDKFVKETAGLLSVPIGETINYAQLQRDAAAQLMQLTMQAEVERAAASRQVEQAQQTVTRLEEEKRQAVETAAIDGLTQIANRAAFDTHLELEMARSRSENCTVGLILLDVDHFKAFNDTHGHQAGDEVLKSVADCLKTIAGTSAFVARYGGEEFAVVATKRAEKELRALAESIRRAIETRKTLIKGMPLRVTASLGAAVSAPATIPTSREELIAQADKRLYKAKHAGRNRVVAA
jgi:two-component system, cell cycle response regulator